MSSHPLDIPFNKNWITGREAVYVADAQASNRLSSGGQFAGRCSDWLVRRTGAAAALLTTSGTSALEMAALLSGVGPGDEVILPSYTFTSTANAFVLRGAVPVFVDIRSDTLNIDETLVEAAVTPRTRAIVPVHYAGVGCEMDAIMDIAARRNLLVVEDAAQGLGASYRGTPLGAFGGLAALSFHETKNVTSGEGGALLVNDERFNGRAEVVCRFGTDRLRFDRGETNRYQWIDVGSSALASELTAAYLWAQLESFNDIIALRTKAWLAYHEAFAKLETEGFVRRPVVPRHCMHNAHMYYLLLPDRARRDRFIERLTERGIQSVFHYVPLHESPMGYHCGRVAGPMTHTGPLASRLARLPLWAGIHDHLERVVEAVNEAVRAAEKSCY